MNLTQFQHSKESHHPHFLLFGNPVDHSLSPLMHNTAAQLLGIDIRYHAIQLRPDELSTLESYLNKDTFRGANITIPYKHMLMPYMDELSIVAESIGAINTIIKKDMQLVGDNTDIYGFSVPLKLYADELRGSNAIIFGTGGATKAIIHALSDFGIARITVISRNPSGIHYFDTYENVSIESYQTWASFAGEASIIINATPLGMAPKVDEAPINEAEKHLLEHKICYDIVYKPLQTKFLKMADEAGARTIGGLDMLIHQGSKSFELWTGNAFPIPQIKQKLHASFR